MSKEQKAGTSSPQGGSEPVALPAHVAGSTTLDQLVETARTYAKQAASENTLKAGSKDGAHFARWCRMKGTDPLPPSPEMIGLYLADLAAPADKAPALSASTIDRRLSGLPWNNPQRGFTLDRKNRHIATVLPEQERLAQFSGHSLRAGLASSAEVDERYVQKHLGHACTEMTRRHQRLRDRFRANLTMAAGP